MRSGRAGLALTGILLSMAAVAAQQPAFRTQTRLVVVHATFTVCSPDDQYAVSGCLGVTGAVIPRPLLRKNFF